MLDRTQPDRDHHDDDAAPSSAPETDSSVAAAAEPTPRSGWRPLELIRRAGRYFAVLTFSSLTRRIVSLNLVGLVALVTGILYLSQFRAGLIDARAQSLLVQAEIIASTSGQTAACRRL